MMSPKTRQEFDAMRKRDDSASLSLRRQIESDARTHLVGIGQELATNMNQSLNGQRPFDAYFVVGDDIHDALHEAFISLANLPALDTSDEASSHAPKVFEYEGYSNVIVRVTECYKDTNVPHSVNYTVLPAVELVSCKY